MMQNFKIINLITICLFFLSSCTKDQNPKSFEINRSVNTILKSNKKCLEIFDKVLGVDSNYVKKNLYTESLINRFIKYNKGEKYSRLIFLKLIEEGEVYTSTLLGIQIKNKNALVTKYVYENEQPKFVSEKTNDFNPDTFLKSFSGEELKRDRNYNLLIIDFKSNELCDCSFSGSLSRVDVNKIKNLTYFR